MAAGTMGNPDITEHFLILLLSSVSIFCKHVMAVEDLGS